MVYNISYVYGNGMCYVNGNIWMKEPKRVQKGLETLDTLLEWLHYYMGDCKEFKTLVRKDVKELGDLLRELSVDQKIQNIRLARKLKARWKSEEDSRNEEK